MHAWCMQTHASAARMAVPGPHVGCAGGHCPILGNSAGHRLPPLSLPEGLPVVSRASLRAAFQRSPHAVAVVRVAQQQQQQQQQTAAEQQQQRQEPSLPRGGVPTVGGGGHSTRGGGMPLSRQRSNGSQGGASGGSPVLAPPATLTPGAAHGVPDRVGSSAAPVLPPGSRQTQWHAARSAPRAGGVATCAPSSASDGSGGGGGGGSCVGGRRSSRQDDGMSFTLRASSLHSLRTRSLNPWEPLGPAGRPSGCGSGGSGGAGTDAIPAGVLSPAASCVGAAPPLWSPSSPSGAGARRRSSLGSEPQASPGGSSGAGAAVCACCRNGGGDGGGDGGSDSGEQLARLEPVFINEQLRSMLDIKNLQVGWDLARAGPSKAVCALLCGSHHCVHALQSSSTDNEDCRTLVYAHAATECRNTRL